MKAILRILITSICLSSGCQSTIQPRHDAKHDDGSPFTSGLPVGRLAVERWAPARKRVVYTFNPSHRYPPGHPSESRFSKFNALDYCDELINPAELAYIRFFAARGVDFMAVDGSMLCLSKYDEFAIGHLGLYKHHLIVIQTEENIVLITKILKDYEPFEITSVDDVPEGPVVRATP